jgi:membrane protease YdiL (CAAX protease family)
MRKSLPYIMPIFRSVLFISGGLFFAVLSNQSLADSAKWWSILCIGFNIITILVLVIVSKYEGSSYKDLINHKKEQQNFKYILLIIVLMLFIGVGGLFVFGFAIYGYIPTILIQPIPVWLAIINIILLPITIVFAELPLYYGYSFNKIKESTGNKLLAISYITFFYALQHSFIPLLFDWKYILFRFLSFLPLIIVIGIIYNKKKALTPLMIGHGILDLATGAQLLISSLFPAIFEIMQYSAHK